MSRPVVLVTGTRGLIGQEVVRQLRQLPELSLVVADHRWASVEELLGACGPRVDRCIHLGWYTAPADYLTNVGPNIQSLNAAVMLFEVLARMGSSHLVMAGSSAEYAPKHGVLTEEDAVRPWSVYGATKASAHLLLESSLCPVTLSWAWGRIFNVTGLNEAPDRLIPTVAHSLAEGRTIELSAGEQIRDYLSVRDVASALISLSLSHVNGTFNISSGRGTALRDVLLGIADRFSRRDLLLFGARAYGPHDTPIVVGDNSRLRAATGWEPRDDIASIIDSWGRWVESRMKSSP